MDPNVFALLVILDVVMAVPNRQGGPKMANYKPPKLIVWNKNQVSGTVNAFQELKTYIDIVSTFCKK